MPSQPGLSQQNQDAVYPCAAMSEIDATKEATPAITETSSKSAEMDISGLRRVPGRIPKAALLILMVELGERFTYFGLSGPIQNYINNPYDPSSDLPGALGKGQSVASALGNFFKFWAYASCVLGAIVADQYLGKFKTILVACGIYVVGLLILVTTSFPGAFLNGAGMGGIVTAMVVLGLATGGIKANVTPMCAEQYKDTKPVLKTLKSGETVLVDPELTIQRMFMWFYWVVNVGALSPLITVNVEHHQSFWLAFLIPLIAILVTTVVFLSGHKKYVKTPPQGSAIVDAARITTMAVREKGFDNVTPENLAAAGKLGRYKFTATDRYTKEYVGEVRSGVRACKVSTPPTRDLSQAG